MTVLSIAPESDNEGLFLEHQLIKNHIERKGGDMHTYYIDRIISRSERVCLSDEGFIIGESEYGFEDIEGVHIHPYIHSSQILKDSNESKTKKKNYKKIIETIGRIIQMSGANSVNLQHPKYLNDVYMIQKFQQNTIPHPKTIITNSRDEIEYFCRDNEEVILKPVRYPIGMPKKIGKKQIKNGGLPELSGAPFIVQKYVSGPECRVYVVDNEVVGGVTINSEKASYKYEKEKRHIGWSKRELQPETKDVAIRARTAIGSPTGAVDMVLDKGSPTVIETNTIGRFIMLEKFGVPVSEAIAEYLLTGNYAKDRSGFSR